jgi:hypothetical protein
VPTVEHTPFTRFDLATVILWDLPPMSTINKEDPSCENQYGVSAHFPDSEARYSAGNSKKIKISLDK